MNPTQAGVAPPLPDLRPRKPGEILDAAIKVWGANIKKLAVITAVLSGAFQLAGSLALTLLKPTVTDEIQRVQGLRDESPKVSLNLSPRMFVGPGIDLFLNSVGNAAVIAATAVVVFSLYRSQATTTRFPGEVKDVLKEVLGRGHVVLGAHLLAVAIAVLAGMAVTIPVGIAGELSQTDALITSSPFLGAAIGTLTYLVLHAALPATVPGSLGAIATLKQSVRLSKRHRRSILSAAFVLSVATAIPDAIITVIVESTLSALGGDNASFEFVWSGLARTVAAALCLPIAGIGAVYVYVNLRLHAGHPPILPSTPDQVDPMP